MTDAALLARELFAEPASVDGGVRVLVGDSAPENLTTLAQQLVHALHQLHGPASAQLGDRPEISSGSLVWFGLDAPDDQLLGALCRACPQRVLVCVSGADRNAATSRFFAFGFRRWRASESESGSPPSDSGASWFEFSLKHYKSVPDWLNARFWAHPERFHLREELP